VALQGSIDTFALDDVLRLMASTGKTGRLSLRGSRGVGELVVLDGRVLDGAVSTDNRVGDLHELVFELLRFEDGDFVFEAESIDGIEGVEPLEVDGLLTGASELLAEWRDIERVIPKGRAGVSLIPDGPGNTVKIEPAQWRVIAAVGGGAGVEELSERLDASNLTIGRLLRSLAEHGLVSVTPDDGSATSTKERPIEPVEEPVRHDAPAAFDEAPIAPTEYAPFSVDDPWADASPVNGSNGNGSSHVAVDSEVLFDSAGGSATDTLTDRDLDLDRGHDEVAVASVPLVDAAEFARRLAELPPRAAKAVAAAARATSVEERQAALAELDGTGEEVDHEVLLQLLGPVDG
jgi:hypothetical protein